MAVDSRYKNATWTLPTKNPGYPGAQLAVLMDIRDELKKLNAVFECYNFLRIPRVLDAIQVNTKKPKKKTASFKK